LTAVTGGWLSRWSGRRGPDVRDRVWLDASACTAGLLAQAGAAQDQGDAVLVLVRSAIDLPAYAQAFASRQPRVADDSYAAADLRGELLREGALALSRVDVLRPLPGLPPGASRAALQVHVRARDPRRSADARLLALLEPFAPATIAFHHALDDGLLREHARALQPLLRPLHVPPQEAIDSPLLTRAIQRAQRP
jgi:hypothetical protein